MVHIVLHISWFSTNMIPRKEDRSYCKNFLGFCINVPFWSPWKSNFAWKSSCDPLKFQASAIVVLTTTGKTAHIVSKYRPLCPILAVTRFPQVRWLDLFIWITSAHIISKYRPLCPILAITRFPQGKWPIYLDYICQDCQNRIPSTDPFVPSLVVSQDSPR